MRIASIALLSLILYSSVSWETDFEKARQTAKADHKLILLNFSGSDWCGPCIRMHDEIFGSDNFQQYAGGHLVLVNADFPRLRKHELSKEQQKKNDALADLYNKDGIFPLTVLLTPDGKVLKQWEGFPSAGAEVFTSQVKSLVEANR